METSATHYLDVHEIREITVILKKYRKVTTNPNLYSRRSNDAGELAFEQKSIDILVTKTNPQILSLRGAKNR
jgi:hypothetical protein